MHVIICEDEKIYQKSLQDKITTWSERTNHHDTKVTVFASSEDFLYQWQCGMRADILFLDIQFRGELNGIELAVQIRAEDANTPIVFITNSDAYVLEGYSVSALRYLCKPIFYEDIALCLDITHRQWEVAKTEFFIITTSRSKSILRFPEILYLEAQSPHTLIYRIGQDEPMKVRIKFAEVKQQLCEDIFVPCHRSYVVNLSHVRGLKTSKVQLSTGKILPISKPYSHLVNQAFDRYYQGGIQLNGLDCI